MNYIIGIVILMTIVICLASFPVPTAIGLAVAGLWWVLKGRKGRVR